MEFKRETIEEVEVTFSLSDSGRFVATIVAADGTEEQVAVDATYEGAVAKAQKQLKPARAKLGIRFFDTTVGQHRTVTGIHAGTGAYLVTTDGKKGSDQIHTYGLHRQCLRVLTPEEVLERARLIKAHQDAVAAVEEFSTSRRIDLKEIVDEAVRKQVTGQ